MDLLTEWIQCAPEPEFVKLMGMDAPDKYISGLANLARVAGFTDKTETTVDVTVNYRLLSDSQIEDLLAKRARTLGLDPVIDEASHAERVLDAPERIEIDPSGLSAARDPEPK